MAEDWRELIAERLIANDLRGLAKVAMDMADELQAVGPARGAKREPLPKSRAGYVYYIGDGEVVKIGRSKNPWARLESIRTSRPSAEILATEVGGPALELARHEEFAKCRIEREWFTRSPELVAHIERLRVALKPATSSQPVATPAPVAATVAVPPSPLPSRSFPTPLSNSSFPSPPASSSAQADVENSVESVDNFAPVTPTERRIADALETDRDRQALGSILAKAPNRFAWSAEIAGSLDGMHGPALSGRQLGEVLRDYVGNGHHEQPNFRHFRAYLRRPDRPELSGNGVASGPKGSIDATGEAGAILARLKTTSEKGEAPEVRQAVKALGGLSAVRDCKPERWGLLTRDFVAHLAFARKHPEPEAVDRPTPPPVVPPAEVERPAMAEARAREEAWQEANPGLPLPLDFHFKRPARAGN